MSEAKLPICYCSQPKPGVLWKASCFMPREIAFAQTEAEAKAALKEALGPLAALGIHWIDGPEPGPPRSGAASDKLAVENIAAKEREERITETYRKGLLMVHPDKASDGPLDRDTVTRAFTELYEAAVRR